MAHVGRPKSNNPKDIRFSIRLDASLDEELEGYCERNNIVKADAIRQAIRMLLSEERQE